MEYTYQLQEEGYTVKRTDKNGDVLFIPVSESNADYQAYLRWLNGEE